MPSFFEQPGLSSKFQKDLYQRELDATGSKKWIEAIFLQIPIVEYGLRSLIRETVKGRYMSDENDYKQFWDEKKDFDHLIGYIHLLGADGALISDIDAYRKQRNRLAHRILSFQSITQLDNFAEKTYQIGERVLKGLLKAVGDAQKESANMRIQEQADMTQ